MLKHRVAYGCILSALALLAAVAGDAGHARAGENFTIRVAGAEAMVPLMQKLGEAYQKSHADVKFEITGGGAGKGVTQTLAGKVELGMVSRSIEADEASRGAFVVVAKDSVFMTANAANPDAKALAAKGISKKTCKALWLAGKPMSWGEIAGSGGKESIQVYTRQDACGAAETWAKFLGATQADLQGAAVKGDKDLAESVAKDRNGLGYNNLQAAYDLTTGSVRAGLLVIPIDANGNGTIDPDEDLSTKDKAFAAIAKGTYPAPPARSLHLLTKGQFKGPTKEFVRWILGEGQAVVAAAGYIPLDAQETAAARAKLDQ